MTDIVGKTADPVRWEEMLTLAEAALLGGPSAHTLKQQAERGRLQARKVAGRWLTTRGWLEEYLAAHARKQTSNRDGEGARADGG